MPEILRKWRWLIVAITFVGVAFVASLVVGQQIREYRLNKRLKHSIEIVEKDIADHPHSLTAEFDRSVSAELHFANICSLRVPRIAIAWVGSDGHRLVVSWVADAASADGVALIGGGGKTLLTLHIPPIYVPELARMEREGVLYDVLVDTVSDGDARVELISGEWSKLHVVLLRHGTIISPPAAIVVPERGS
jgi:hypothetical protein